LIKFKSLIIVLSVLLPVLAKADEEPKRIVSLAPSITESLYQLGRGDTLIATTSYCSYPEQTKTKQSIGSLTSPNIEKIYSFSPDLVLAVNGINRPQAIEKLKSLGLKVTVFNECISFSDIKENFIQLAILVDRKKGAKEIIENVEAELSYITNKLKKSPRVKVFWEIGARPLVTAGKESFANELIYHAGGINIFNEAPGKYPRVSREEVIKKNPEAIILAGMGDVTEKEAFNWQRFNELEAAKFNRIYFVDAYKVCQPTPLSYLTGLKLIAGLLHPEVFSELNCHE